MSEVITVVKRRGRPVGSKNTVPMNRMDSLKSALRRRAYNQLANPELYNINSGIENPENDIEWTFSAKHAQGRKPGEKMVAYKSMGNPNLDYKSGSLVDGKWVFTPKNKVGRPSQHKQEGVTVSRMADDEENAFDDDEEIVGEVTEDEEESYESSVTASWLADPDEIIEL